MLTRLHLQHFRCFADQEIHLGPGRTIITGPNAQGKTSILEAACVLLRLHTPRGGKLTQAIAHGRPGLALQGHHSGHLLQYYHGHRRHKLLLDSAEQKTATHYLTIGAAVWLANTDLTLITGAAETRRRYLDFLGDQATPGYRQARRDYQHTLRARNHLLRAHPHPPWAQIEAYTIPLAETARHLTTARATLIEQLTPHITHLHAQIAGPGDPPLTPAYANSAPLDGDLAHTLRHLRPEETRHRHTLIGPHLDDLTLHLGGHPLHTHGSEGQQRTAALALKLAQARHLHLHRPAPPLLLLDDIFGELDPHRRNALLHLIPQDHQTLITTTHLNWLDPHLPARHLRLQNHTLTE